MRILLPALALLLAGCADVLAGGRPPEEAILAAAEPNLIEGDGSELLATPAAAGTPACKEGQGTGEIEVEVRVVGPRQGGLSGAPIGYRARKDDDYTIVGFTGADGRARVTVPIGTALSVSGIESQPAETCARRTFTRAESGIMVPKPVAAEFLVPEVCLVHARLVDDAGAPVAGGSVQWEGLDQDAADGGGGGVLSDADGRLDLYTACGPTRLSTVAPGGAVRAPVTVAVDDGMALDLVAPTRWIELRGRLSGAEASHARLHLFVMDRLATDLLALAMQGPRARTSSSQFGRSDASGHYVMRYDPGDDGIHHLRLGALVGDDEEAEIWARRGQSYTVNLGGAALRPVALRCLGYEGERCTSIGHFRCVGEAGAPGGDDEWTTVDGVKHKQVWCPAGPAVVHANGKAVRVAAHEQAARFDFRPLGGGVRVELPALPAGCSTSVDTSTASRVLAGRQAVLAFPRARRGSEVHELEHLAPGAYTFHVTCREGKSILGEERVSLPFDVADEIVDLGRVEVPS